MMTAQEKGTVDTRESCPLTVLDETQRQVCVCVYVRAFVCARVSVRVSVEILFSVCPNLCLLSYSCGQGLQNEPK